MESCLKYNNVATTLPKPRTSFDIRHNSNDTVLNTMTPVLGEEDKSFDMLIQRCEGYCSKDNEHYVYALCTELMQRAFLRN
mmetsp:Transcript_91517/g.137028  ORF Transcript_91517/g.137028 Transcript_91517/m.137028 type:complete len:81 (-) Transcript_91517:24-266(-)